MNSPLLYCAVGGALGAGLRFLLSLANAKSFPMGTFTANLLATFLMCLAIKSADGLQLSFFSAGFAASLSTFSTFALEIDEMIKSRRFYKAIFYSASSVALGIAIALIAI